MIVADAGVACAIAASFAASSSASSSASPLPMSGVRGLTLADLSPGVRGERRLPADGGGEEKEAAELGTCSSPRGRAMSSTSASEAGATPSSVMSTWPPSSVTCRISAVFAASRPATLASFCANAAAFALVRRWPRTARILLEQLGHLAPLDLAQLLHLVAQLLVLIRKHPRLR